MTAIDAINNFFVKPLSGVNESGGSRRVQPAEFQPVDYSTNFFAGQYEGVNEKIPVGAYQSGQTQCGITQGGITLAFA